MGKTHANDPKYIGKLFLLSAGKRRQPGVKVSTGGQLAVDSRQSATVEGRHRVTCLHVDTRQLVASACGIDRVQCANRVCGPIGASV